MPDATRRVPSVEQLRAIHDALHSFVVIDEHSLCSFPQAQEEFRLPNFTRLADALRSVRPLTGKVTGWPIRLGRALPLVIDGFDRAAADWGWEDIARPERDRSASVKQRKDLFRERYDRPVYEAAISWQEGSEASDCPLSVEKLADEGRSKGFHATMASDHAEGLLRNAIRERDHATCLGHRFPRLKPMEGLPEGHQTDGVAYRKLKDGYSLLESVLQGIEAEERARQATLSPTAPVATTLPLPAVTMTESPSLPAASGATVNKACVERLTPGAKAIAAALDIQKEGRGVTLKAVCKRAGVDRGHLRERYPDAVRFIRAIAAPDRSPRRGAHDRRTGNFDGVVESDD